MNDILAFSILGGYLRKLVAFRYAALCSQFYPLHTEVPEKDDD
jgi:hypothetical protein